MIMLLLVMVIIIKNIHRPEMKGVSLFLSRFIVIVFIQITALAIVLRRVAPFILLMMNEFDYMVNFSSHI
jgi:hypothetical protein